MCTYDLKYNDYYTNINEGLCSLLASADNADVTLAVEGQFFKTHQMVLSIFSPYFRELFNGNPCKHPIFFMKNVKYNVMKDLLTFMYEGKVQIAEEDFNDFVETAKELKVKGLTNIAEPLPTQHNEMVDIAATTANLKHLNEENQITPSIEARSLKRSHAIIQAKSIIEDDICASSHHTTKKIKSQSSISPASSAVHGNIPNRSDVSFLPFPAPPRKIDSPKVSHEITNSHAAELNNSLEVHIKDTTISACEIKSQSLPMFGLDVVGVNHAPFNTDDTIDLDDDDDDYPIKTEPNDGTVGAQEDDEDLLEPLEDIPSEHMFGQEGEPAKIRIVKLENISERTSSGIKLPIANDSELHTVREELIDKSDLLTLELAAMCVRNVRRSVRQILKKLITKEMAQKYSSKGKTGKRDFSASVLCHCVIGAIKQRFNSATDAEIIRDIGAVLASCGDWDGARRQHTKKKRKMKKH